MKLERIQIQMSLRPRVVFNDERRAVAVAVGIEIQRILRSVKRRKKGADWKRGREENWGWWREEREKWRHGRGRGARRGESGEKKELRRVGGSMVRKRWTAKMEGDETRGERPLPASRCVQCGIRMRCRV